MRNARPRAVLACVLMVFRQLGEFGSLCLRIGAVIGRYDHSGAFVEEARVRLLRRHADCWLAVYVILAAYLYDDVVIARLGVDVYYIAEFFDNAALYSKGGMLVRLEPI